MSTLFLLNLKTGGRGGHVGEALYINGFARPLTKNTMWAHVGRWAQNDPAHMVPPTCPLWKNAGGRGFSACIPLNSNASPTCPLRPLGNDRHLVKEARP